MTGTKVGAIYAAMSAVMADLDAIGKDSQNKTQKWKFRGIDAVYNAIHPLMVRHKIFTVPRVCGDMKREERESHSGGTLLYTIIKMEYDFTSGVDGSIVTVGPVMGEAMDSGDKSCNKCMAAAHKYAICQTFVIPTEKSDDPDVEAHEIVGPPIEEQKLKEAWAEKLAWPDIVAIENEAGAKDLVGMMIKLAKQNTTPKGLVSFWEKNMKVIDALDTDYPEQYKRLVAAFTEVKNAIKEKGK